MARVGAFRGFGGLFLSPPMVSYADGHFYVSAADQQWLLTADLFGATFHRADHALTPNRPKSPFKIEKNGTVTQGAQTRQFPELENCKSWVADATTLAVTSPLSHAVYLIALTSL